LTLTTNGCIAIENNNLIFNAKSQSLSIK